MSIHCNYATFGMKYFLGCLPPIFWAHVTWVTIKRRKYGFAGKVTMSLGI